MTEYERYVFGGVCPYTGENCNKDYLPCAECEVNEREKHLYDDESEE